MLPVGPYQESNFPLSPFLKGSPPRAFLKKGRRIKTSMKKKESLTWIPLYVDKWLYGSTRDELEVDECAVWIDLIALAAKDCGFIRANEGFAYSETRLAGLLGRQKELIHRTIEKCLKTHGNSPNERPKLTRLEDGTLFVTSWHEYQFTDRYLRTLGGKAQKTSGKAEHTSEKAEQSSEKTEHTSEKAEPIREDNIKDNKRREYVAGQASNSDAIKTKIRQVVEKWNEFARAHNIPWIRGIDRGSGRERSLLCRIREGVDFNKVFEAIEAQPFLTGDNDQGWLINFDWILKPANLTKILEGAYVRIRRGEAARRAPDDPMTGDRSRFERKG